MTKQQIFFSFINDFFSEIFGFDNKDYFKLKGIKSKTVPVSEDILKKNYSWENLLGRSNNYQDILKKFNDKKNIWEDEHNALKEIASPTEMSLYLNKYIQNPITRSQIEKGVKPQKYLQERLQQIKPKIQNYYNANYNGFQNIIIFETKYFHLSLHLKLTQKLTKTYECLAIFSIWFEAPESLSILNIEWINGISHALILGYEISQSLKRNKFSNEILFPVEKNYPQTNNSGRIINKWVLKKPLLFITQMKLLLNINPFNLFQDVALVGSQMIEICENFKKSKVQSPLKYYQNLNLKIQDFLKRGRILFEKADNASKFLSNRVTENKEPVHLHSLEKFRKKSGLTPEILFSLFSLSYEQDSKKKIEDRGFRSLNKIYSEYGKEYHFSKQTVYNCFNDSDLDFRLENRYTIGKGGGKQYRIKIIESKLKINMDVDDQIYIKELMKIEEGLTYFNQEKYEKSLKIFAEILTHPSKILKERTQYYYGTMFYSGRIYFLRKDYINAQKYFEKIINENTQLFDVNYYLILCYFKNNNNTQLQELIESNIKEIYKIFTVNGISFEDHKDLLKGKLSFPIDYARKFFGKQAIEKELKNFIIYINSKEIENRFRFNVRLDEIEIFNLNQNIIAYERLRKTLALSIILKLELLREKIFKNILLNDKSKIYELLKEFLAVTNDRITEKIFYEEYFYDYILYFRNQLDYYPIEFSVNEFKKFVVDFNSKVDLESYRGLLGENFPDELRSISDFLGTINNFHKFKRRTLRPSLLIDTRNFFNHPRFKFEYILTQFLKIENTNALKLHLDELTNKYKELQNKKDLEIDQLFTSWFRFRSPYSNAGIDDLQQTIHNAIDSIKTEQDFIEFKTIFEEIQQKVDKFILKVNTIRKNGSKYTINKIFKLLSIRYNPQENISHVDISTTLEELYKDGDFYSHLLNKLQEFLEEINGRKILRFSFFNSEIRDEGKRIIIKMLKSFWSHESPFRLIILEDPSPKSIELSYEATLNLGEGFDLDENLEAILYELISVIRSNYDQLIIKSQKLKDEKFKNSIQDSLKKELDNDYLTLEIENFKSNNEIIIKINKNSRE